MPKALVQEAHDLDHTHPNLKGLLDVDAAVILDVRPAAEFDAGHIEGARSIPIDRLAEEVRTLPKDAEVVAYCRGHFCVFADEAVRLLHRRGHPARRLADGFPEWRAAGLPVGSALTP